jgi:hypothetical protein
MASGTIGSIRSIVFILSGMTGITAGRGPLIEPIDMTIRTADAKMRPSQLE